MIFCRSHLQKLALNLKKTKHKQKNPTTYKNVSPHKNVNQKKGKKNYWDPILIIY